MVGVVTISCPLLFCLFDLLFFSFSRQKKIFTNYSRSAGDQYVSFVFVCIIKTVKTSEHNFRFYFFERHLQLLSISVSIFCLNHLLNMFFPLFLLLFERIMKNRFDFARMSFISGSMFRWTL